MRRLENFEALDGPVRVLGPTAERLVGTGRRRTLLEGHWLGHTFHALLSDFVEGPWMAASFLDLFGPPGSERAARRLLGLGLAVAPLAHLSGLADWRQAPGDGPRRVGALHGLAIGGATALYTASYLARLGRRHNTARALGLAGGVVALFDGYAAGHLSHVRGVAVGEQRRGGG